MFHSFQALSLPPLESAPAHQISVSSSWTATQSLTWAVFFVIVIVVGKKKPRKIPILLNASKGLCLSPVLIKGEIYWSFCLRRKSGSDYQIAHQRQVLM